MKSFSTNMFSFHLLCHNCWPDPPHGPPKRHHVANSYCLNVSPLLKLSYSSGFPSNRQWLYHRLPCLSVPLPCFPAFFTSSVRPTQTEQPHSHSSDRSCCLCGTGDWACSATALSYIPTLICFVPASSMPREVPGSCDVLNSNLEHEPRSRFKQQLHGVLTPLGSTLNTRSRSADVFIVRWGPVCLSDYTLTALFTVVLGATGV